MAALTVALALDVLCALVGFLSALYQSPQLISFRLLGCTPSVQSARTRSLVELPAHIRSPFTSRIVLGRPCMDPILHSPSRSLSPFLYDPAHVDPGVSPLPIPSPRQVSWPLCVQDISAMGSSCLLPWQSSPLPKTIARPIWSYRPYRYATPCVSLSFC